MAIFEDGFESNDLSKWDGTFTNGHSPSCSIGGKRYKSGEVFDVPPEKFCADFMQPLQMPTSQEDIDASSVPAEEVQPEPVAEEKPAKKTRKKKKAKEKAEVEEASESEAPQEESEKQLEEQEAASEVSAS